jgi:hypothetical protein
MKNYYKFPGFPVDNADNTVLTFTPMKNIIIKLNVKRCKKEGFGESWFPEKLKSFLQKSLFQLMNQNECRKAANCT